MRRPKYPLEPLAQLRQRKANEAAEAFATAVVERENAERACVDAERRRAMHEAEAHELRQAEADALGRGELRAGDLARTGAWELGVSAQRQRHDDAVERAKGQEGRARDGERDARERVASARADVDVVDKDRAKWRDSQLRREEAQEEEAASEAWRRKG
jgi:hypothetical protein